MLDVFTRPAPVGGEISPTASARNGYHLIRWARSGINYWVVSDLDREELRHFIELLRHAESR